LQLRPIHAPHLTPHTYTKQETGENTLLQQKKAIAMRVTMTTKQTTTPAKTP